MHAASSTDPHPGHPFSPSRNSSYHLICLQQSRKLEIAFGAHTCVLNRPVVAAHCSACSSVLSQPAGSQRLPPARSSHFQSGCAYQTLQRRLGVGALEHVEQHRQRQHQDANGTPRRVHAQTAGGVWRHCQVVCMVDSCQPQFAAAPAPPAGGHEGDRSGDCSRLGPCCAMLSLARQHGSVWGQRANSSVPRHFAHQGPMHLSLQQSGLPDQPLLGEPGQGRR